MSAFTSELEDRFTAHVCAVNGRCSRARLAALRERCAGSDSVLSLGQLLMRERLLRASEYLELRRWLERPLLRCPACEQPFSLAEGEHAGEDGAVLRCPHCGTISEPDALLEAIDPDAIRLPAREDADAAGRLLSGRESQILGRTIGGYEIVGVLGIGAMGVVYRARQLELDRLVALKVLRAGEQASGAQLERFLAEARAVARLQHPGIVRIHEIGHEQGVHFFSMELIEGPTLQQVLEDEGRLEPGRAAELLEQVARAVHHAHERGIVHRDLKPGNILLDAEGRPHITDFGLAHDTGRDTSLTRSGVAIGTPLYMSPEQVRGDSQAVGPASDVFALGTILYRTLTATLPFSGSHQVEIYNAILYERPIAPRRLERRLPRDLETICMKALEKRPADRYRSAAAFADDLARWRRGEPIRARPLPWYERAGRRLRQHRRAVAALLLLAVAVLGGLAWLRHDRARRQQLARERASARRLAAQRAELARAGAALVRGRPDEALERAEALLHDGAAAGLAPEARRIAARALAALGRPEPALARFAELARGARGRAEQREALRDSARLLERWLRPADALVLLSVVTASARAREPADALAWARAQLEADPGEAARVGEELERLLARGALAPGLRREARWLRRWAARFAESVRCDGAEAAAVADVDHDGRPELLLVGTDGIRCGRFEGGRWRELARGPLPDAMGTIEACLGGDVLGDGRDELVVAGGDRQLGRSLRVFRIERTGERLSLRTVARLPLAARAHAAGLALARTGAASGGELLVARAAEGGRQGWRVQLGPEGELLTRALCGALAPLARVEAVAAADLDGDGRDEALVGTRGPGGRDVRLGETAASPAGGTRWRRRVGAVEAIVPVDLDRDGALDLALGLDRSADRSPGRSWPPASVVVLDAGLTTRPGRRMIVPLVPAEPQRWSARFTTLLAADLHASGAPALCALVQTWRTDDGASPPRRRLLVCCERADDRLRVLRIVLPEGTFGWALTADLDLDGDDELVFGGPRQAVVVGLRRRGP